MTDIEFTKIWNLLETTYCNSKSLKDPKTRRIWAVALEPYAVQEVTDRLLAHIRQHKYPPAIADMTANLSADTVSDHSAQAWMIPYCELIDRKIMEKYGGEEGWEAHRREMGWEPHDCPTLDMQQCLI